MPGSACAITGVSQGAALRPRTPRTTSAAARSRMVMPEAADDYDLLQFELDEVYDNPQAEGADE